MAGWWGVFGWVNDCESLEINILGAQGHLQHSDMQAGGCLWACGGEQGRVTGW